MPLQAKQVKHHNGLFLIACSRGLLSEAQQLMDMGAQPGTQDKGGLSSAHFAAAHGKDNMLSFLWSKGVELDGEDPSELLMPSDQICRHIRCTDCACTEHPDVGSCADQLQMSSNVLAVAHRWADPAASGRAERTR
jgi:ankyrin repeat protein